MKLRVERITEEAQTCSFSEDAERLNQRLDSGSHDFRLLEPLGVELTYYRAGDDLYFDGQARMRLEGACARCLEPFVLALDFPCEFVLTPAVPTDKPELRAEDLALSTYTGDEVDLAPLLEEQAILALPTRALCREDCMGLCPACGANRNLAPCGCRPGQADPRFAALRGLKVGRAS